MIEAVSSPLSSPVTRPPPLLRWHPPEAPYFRFSLPSSEPAVRMFSELTKMLVPHPTLLLPRSCGNTFYETSYRLRILASPLDSCKRCAFLSSYSKSRDLFFSPSLICRRSISSPGMSGILPTCAHSRKTHIFPLPEVVVASSVAISPRCR